jgi:hypothetical protein
MGGIKHQNMGGKHHWFTIKGNIDGWKKHCWKIWVEIKKMFFFSNSPCSKAVSAKVLIQALRCTTLNPSYHLISGPAN